MQELKGFPYFEVEFDKQGEAHDRSQVDALADFVAAGNVSDLFVISHGWNNDMAAARGLYDCFFDCVRQVIDSGKAAGVAGRTFAIMAVLWPSKKFAEADLIASGAAGAESPITNDLLKRELEQLKGVFDQPDADARLEQAAQLVVRLEDSPKACRSFADLLRSLLPQESSADVDAAGQFLALDGNELIRNRLSKAPAAAKPAAGAGGGAAIAEGTSAPAAGGAAGLGNFFSGVKAGALRLLNFTTYYQMKERAGTVGSNGVNQVLRSVRERRPGVKLHLIGHSFGGRVVTAAAAGLDGAPAVGVETMTLLQAAFSHYGFAEHYEGGQNGFFRRVVADRMVSGPIVISCTVNDEAVGKIYPLASLVAGQVAADLGDKDDRYGGIGRNGAQKTPEASDGTILTLDEAYHFEPGRLHNLNADAVIKGHSDICHNEVAYALLNAVSLT